MFECFECGDTKGLHRHHVVPRSLGGTRTVVLCGRCHGLAHGLGGDTWAEHRALTRAALAAKKARGERTGGVPFGFRLASDGVHLEVDPVEAEALAVIRELRASGLSLRGIAAELEARGFPARGGRWHPMAVSRVLGRAA